MDSGGPGAAPGLGLAEGPWCLQKQNPRCRASTARSLKTGPPHPPQGDRGWPAPWEAQGAACALDLWLCDSSHMESFQPGACRAWATGAGVLNCPVFAMIAGSPSRLSVGEQPEVTHDPYEFLQSPEPAASTKS